MIRRVDLGWDEWLYGTLGHHVPHLRVAGEGRGDLGVALRGGRGRG